MDIALDDPPLSMTGGDVYDESQYTSHRRNNRPAFSHSHTWNIVARDFNSNISMHQLFHHYVPFTRIRVDGGRSTGWLLFRRPHRQRGSKEEWTNDIRSKRQQMNDTYWPIRRNRGACRSTWDSAILSLLLRRFSTRFITSILRQSCCPVHILRTLG